MLLLFIYGNPSMMPSTPRRAFYLVFGKAACRKHTTLHRPSGFGARKVQAGLFTSKYSALSGNLHSLLNFWKIKNPPLNHNLRVHEVTTNHVYPPLLAQEVKELRTSRGNMSSIENI